MKKQKHTPGPWHSHKSSTGDGLIYDRSPYDGGRVVGQASMANAARIVACVNACEGLEPSAVRELIEAASDCLADLDHYAATHGPGPDRRRDSLRSALAKIKGE